MSRPISLVCVILLTLTGAAFLRAQAPPTTRPMATLKVTISDLRSDKGTLVFGVFTTKDGFPVDSTKAANWQTRAAKEADHTFVCQLPPGRYGATVLHDENSNDKMDTGAFGIPKEGYGVTNNPKPKMRQAKFEESTFDLPEGGAEMTISLQYF